MNYCSIETLVDEDISEIAVVSLLDLIATGHIPILTFTLMAVSVFTPKLKLRLSN